jgi:hypothetical protein
LAKCAARVDKNDSKFTDKTTVIHRLLHQDCEPRMFYYKWCQESVFTGLLDPELNVFLLDGCGSL